MRCKEQKEEEWIRQGRKNWHNRKKEKEEREWGKEGEKGEIGRGRWSPLLCKGHSWNTWGSITCGAGCIATHFNYALSCWVNKTWPNVNDARQEKMAFFLNNDTLLSFPVFDWARCHAIVCNRMQWRATESHRRVTKMQWSATIMWSHAIACQIVNVCLTFCNNNPPSGEFVM